MAVFFIHVFVVSDFAASERERGIPNDKKVGSRGYRPARVARTGPRCVDRRGRGRSRLSV